MELNVRRNERSKVICEEERIERMSEWFVHDRGKLSGIPQGQELNPLFFIYVNGLPWGLRSCLNVFADGEEFLNKVLC